MACRPFACFMVLMCLVALAAAYWFHTRNEAIHASHHFVSGVVLNMEIRTTRINREQIKRYYHPIVKLELAEGDYKTVILSDGTEVARLKEGDAVNLYYPTGSPNEAKLVSWCETKKPFYASLALALIAALTAIFIWRRPHDTAPATPGNAG